MRRTYFLLVCIMLMIFHCSCNNSYNELHPISYDVSLLENNTDLVCTTEHSEYTNDVKRIKYTIYNSSKTEHWISPSFELHKYDEEKKEWFFVSFSKAVSFQLISQGIFPSESIEKEIDLEEYFSFPLSVGKYRIVLEQKVVSNSFTIT